MIKPLRDFIAVSKQDADAKSSGGIHLVHLDEKLVTAVVVAVGSGYVSESGAIVPLEVTVGDKITFNKTVSVEVKDENQTYLVLREESVLAVLS